jgi:hypothetical protein
MCKATYFQNPFLRPWYCGMQIHFWHQVSHVCVTRDRFWIDDQIYWTLWYRSWLHFTIHYLTCADTTFNTHRVTADIPLPLGSWTIPGLNYQFLIATTHKNWTSAVHWLNKSVTHQPTQLDWLTSLQSQSYIMTGSLPPISSSWCQAPWGSWPEVSASPSLTYFQLNSCGCSPYVTSSLMREWGCLLWMGFTFVKCTHCTYSIGLHGYGECLFFPGSGRFNKSDNLE